MTVLSLCDHSGAWSAPYRAAGYDVVQVDIKAPRVRAGILRGQSVSPPYPTATPADVLASWARYQASLSVALMDGVPAAVLIEHYGRTMAAVRFVLAAMADDAGRGP